MAAADKGALTAEGIAAAVARGVDVNGLRRGEAALHRAVNGSHREAIAALLAAGADANVTDYAGATPTWRCAASGTADVLQLLIDGGGDVNAADGCGESPLIALVRRGRGDGAARLAMLLSCPGLHLDAMAEGRTAEGWAAEEHRLATAAAALGPEVTVSS